MSAYQHAPLEEGVTVIISFQLYCIYLSHYILFIAFLQQGRAGQGSRCAVLCCTGIVSDWTNRITTDPSGMKTIKTCAKRSVDSSSVVWCAPVRMSTLTCTVLNMVFFENAFYLVLRKLRYDMLCYAMPCDALELSSR